MKIIQVITLFTLKNNLYALITPKNLLKIKLYKSMHYKIKHIFFYGMVCILLCFLIKQKKNMQMHELNINKSLGIHYYDTRCNSLVLSLVCGFEIHVYNKKSSS